VLQPNPKEIKGKVMKNTICKQQTIKTHKGAFISAMPVVYTWLNADEQTDRNPGHRIKT